MNVLAKGIDVSKWQGSINWTQVKGAGISFVMMRLGRGKYNGQPCDYDSKFKVNITGALAAGLDVGVYFYSYALTVAEAKAEAEWVINALEPYKGKLTYPVAFDLEDPSQANLGKTVLSDMIVAFGGAIEGAGYYATLYSNSSWLTTKYDAAKIKRFDVWLAQWASAPTYSGSFGMWQHSSKGSVPGITGNVDLDVVYYDYPSVIKKGGLNGFPKGTASAPSPAPEPTPGPITKFTGQGLADYCKGLLGKPSAYMWGEFGREITVSRVDAAAKQYPSHYDAQRIARLKGLVGKGYLGSDCVGMIKSYYWGGVGNVKYDAATDKSAGMMCDAAKVKGSIASIPERPGLCVWMEGHIGVYVGNGEVVECTLGTFGDGIVKTKLSARKWLKWLECPYISYETASTPTEPPKEPEPTPVPDWKEQGLTALVEAGIVSDRDYWAARMNEPITVGEVVGVLGKMLK